MAQRSPAEIRDSIESNRMELAVSVQRLRGEGPPKLNSAKGGSPEKGDIHYRFVIDVPEHLSEEQEKAVEELSRTLGGDPRAGLFASGAGAGSAQGAAAGEQAKGGES